MVHGQTQNFQGFLSDNPVTVVEPTPPYGYCLSVEDLFTKVICSIVSTDTIAKEGAYCGGWRDPELLDFLVEHLGRGLEAFYAILQLSPHPVFADKGHLSQP